MTVDLEKLIDWHPGDALRRIRKQQGMTQAQFGELLASLSGDPTWTDQSKVSDYELGKRDPTYREMRTWARWFEVPFRFITEGPAASGDMRPYLNWALDQTDQPELDLVYAEAS